MFKKNDNQSANLQLVKQANKTLLFNLIYKLGPVSRARLAEITKLSPTTVSTLVAEMLEQNLVNETGIGIISTSGRKPIMLKINPNGGYIISLEMMERAFTCYLFNLECEIISKFSTDLDSYINISEKINKVILQILKDKMIPEERLFGIAISIPALIDKEAQKVIASTIIPINPSYKRTDANGISETKTAIDTNTKSVADTYTDMDSGITAGFDFIPSIKKRFSSIPVILENTSSFYAYAEKEFGQFKNIDHLIFIDIGTGIGAGIIIDGKLFGGSAGLSGEIGHMCIDISGPKCKCGSKGCFEVMAGIPAIKNEIMLALMSGRHTIIKDVIQGDLNRISIDSIVYALEQKDPLICEIIDGTSKKLAIGINNVINIFNPQAIVIGGEITKLGDNLLDLIKGYLKEIELWPQAKKTIISFTNLRNGSVNLGGAKYLLDQLLQTGNILESC